MQASSTPVTKCKSVRERDAPACLSKPSFESSLEALALVTARIFVLNAPPNILDKAVLEHVAKLGAVVSPEVTGQTQNLPRDIDAKSHQRPPGPIRDGWQPALDSACPGGTFAVIDDDHKQR
ncbi:unnamed protein product [Lampetra fluviatilis]